MAEAYVQNSHLASSVSQNGKSASAGASGIIGSASFIPSEGDGGGVTPHGINVDGGVLNPQLNSEEVGPHASAIWQKARLRDHIDAVIAHEYEESVAGTHKGAETRAADTTVPISDTARRILRAITERENQ